VIAPSGPLMCAAQINSRPRSCSDDNGPLDRSPATFGSALSGTLQASMHCFDHWRMKGRFAPEAVVQQLISFRLFPYQSRTDSISCQTLSNHGQSGVPMGHRLFNSQWWDDLSSDQTQHRDFERGAWA
jgi:hypothetical protein